MHHLVYVVACILLIWVLVGIMMLFVHSHKQQRDKIPKRIWTYWGGDMTVLVHMCMDSWRKHNPNLEIILLTKGNLHKYIDIDLDTLLHANDRPSTFADFVRLHVLAKHGGLWMDASVICNKPLDWIWDIQESTGCTFIGYKMKNHTSEKWRGVRDVIENSVFACNPGNELVVAWRDEFMKINNYIFVDEYIYELKEEGIDLPNNELQEEYWACYASFIAVFQRHPEFNRFMYLIEGTETIYAFLHDNNDLSHEEKISNLFQCRYKDQPLVKLNNWDRSVITQHQDISAIFCQPDTVHL